MEYVYAAMLLYKAGKEITEENLSKVLSAAGVDADPVRVKSLVAALEGVDIEEAIKSASLMPVAAAPAAAGAAGAEAAGAKAEEEKKEEKEEEKKEEEALEGLAGLFG